MKEIWIKGYQVEMQLILVREKAKELISLLKDDALIESERENAKALREKLGGGRTQGIGSSNSTYEGYGSNSFQKDSKFNSSGLNSKAYKYDQYGGDRKYHDSSSSYKKNQEPQAGYDSYYEKKPEITIPKPSEPKKDDVLNENNLRAISASSRSQNQTRTSKCH